MLNFRPDTPWIYLSPKAADDDPPGFGLAPPETGGRPASFGFGSATYGPGTSDVPAESTAYGAAELPSQAPLDSSYNAFLFAPVPRHPFQDAFDQLAKIYGGVGFPGPRAADFGSVPVEGGAPAQVTAPASLAPWNLLAFEPGSRLPPMAVAAPAVPRLPGAAEGEVISDAASADGLRDGQQYAEVGRPLPMRGVRVGVDEEGRDALVRDGSAEPDPFEKLKQRGYPQPPQDPGNGSTIVSELRKDYGQHRPFYHRYEFKDPLCDLGTPGCSVEAAYEALKRYAVPGGPARDVPIEDGDVSPASFRGVPGGRVKTLVDPASNSIINRTLPGHPFDDGFAQRQIVVENGKVYLRTFGEGNNASQEKASANMIMAKPAFADSTEKIQAALGPSAAAKSSERWSR